MGETERGKVKIMDKKMVKTDKRERSSSKEEEGDGIMAVPSPSVIQPSNQP